MLAALSQARRLRFEVETGGDVVGRRCAIFLPAVRVVLGVTVSAVLPRLVNLLQTLLPFLDSVYLTRIRRLVLVRRRQVGHRLGPCLKRQVVVLHRFRSRGVLLLGLVLPRMPRGIVACPLGRRVS